MRYSCASHIGKIRKNNEDFCKAETLEINGTEVGIFAVADGMGGHNKGEVASEMAVENIVTFLKNNLIQNETVKINYIDDILKQAYNNVNALIYEKSVEDMSCLGMGTTLTTAIIFKNKLYIANVGDSRCYLLSDDNFRKVTKDHSYVEELVTKHLITEEEAKHHPQKNIITRSLGSKGMILVDIFKFELKENDKILLTTDGMTDGLENEDMYNIINKDDEVENLLAELIDLANENSGRDNISGVLVKFI